MLLNIYLFSPISLSSYYRTVLVTKLEGRRKIIFSSPIPFIIVFMTISIPLRKKPMAVSEWD